MNQQQKDHVMFELIREMLKQQSEEDRLLARRPVIKKQSVVSRFMLKVKTLFRVLPTDQL